MQRKQCEEQFGHFSRARRVNSLTGWNDDHINKVHPRFPKWPKSLVKFEEDQYWLLLLPARDGA